jgi:Ran GTPase-activating protein (RanGAP) involved in mRNA processing and transport
VNLHCPIDGLPTTSPDDLAAIAPLVARLQDDAPVTEAQQFPRGTLLPDGRLDLCKQNLGPEGCARITEALAGNRHVRSLLLGTNGIGDPGAASVARLVEQNRGIEIVYLGCNYIESGGVARIAEAVGAGSVRGLWLKRNPIGEEGAAALAEMLRHNTTLEVLDLVCTGLTPAALEVLLEPLITTNRTVRCLYLGGNTIDKTTAGLLGDLLRANDALRMLSVATANLGNAGLGPLAVALRQNTTLTSLGLASNGITTLGAAFLFRTVEENRALERLDLGFAPSTRALGALPNCIGDDGALWAAATLNTNRVLRFLDLRGNGIGTVGRNRLAEAAETNTTLLRLDLDGTPDPRITAALQRNAAVVPPLQRDPDLELIRSVYRNVRV